MSPYETFKGFLYKKNFRSYFNEIFMDEILGVLLINGKKKDHPRKGSKDLLDAVVGSIYSLVSLKINSSPRYFRAF